MLRLAAHFSLCSNPGAGKAIYYFLLDCFSKAHMRLCSLDSYIHTSF